MKRLQYREFGPPSTFQVADVDDATPGEAQVVADVRAASLNPLDLKVSAGQLPVMTDGQFPKGFGADLAGTIVDVGTSVTGFQPGDRVIGSIPIATSGAFAHRAVLPVANAVHLPDHISFDAGAALPMAGSAALQALSDTADIGTGARVLINGGAGGVGSFAIQIAKALGATVTATASGPALDVIGRLG